MEKRNKTEAAKQNGGTKGHDVSQDQSAPAGNAILDPANQTRRQDMPEEEQPTSGPSLRGSAPSKSPDHSHQPERDDHRSNQDWGSASQSGKRQGT